MYCFVNKFKVLASFIVIQYKKNTALDYGFTFKMQKNPIVKWLGSWNVKEKNGTWLVPGFSHSYSFLSKIQTYMPGFAALTWEHVIN